MIRKNISISDTHLKQLDPLLKKHKGNLSASVRDIIDFIGFVTQHTGSLETAKDLLKVKNHAREQTLNRIYGVSIPLTIFRWLLINRKCVIPPADEAIQLFKPNDVNIYDVNSLNKIINEELSFLNWPVTVKAGIEDGQISLQITGIDPEINKFNAILISMFFAYNKNPHKISKLLVYPASVYMQLNQAASSEEALKLICSTLEGNKEEASHQNNVILINARA